MRMSVINLDHISANPLPREVKDVMIEAIENDYHNPSSQHMAGEQAANLLEQARSSVAQLLGAQDAKEIVFTSGGTESINHAIKGVALANQSKGKHIITSNIEHNAVIRSLKRLSAQGFKVTSLPVDETGRVNPDEVKKALTDETILVSIMHSNNETGTIQDIQAIGQITREHKVLFHTDAVDSVGILPLNVQDLQVDLCSFASNTFYGPAGVGGLYIRRGTKIFPLLEGGIQENNKRGGRENLIGIIGLGKAAELAIQNMEARLGHLNSLKQLLISELPNFVDECIINTHPEHSLPYLLNISVRYIEGESVMLMLSEEDIAVATKSACATGSLRASHVLLSLGLSHADAQGTLVISWGLDNTKEDIYQFLKTLKTIVETLRSMSPLYKKKAS